MGITWTLEVAAQRPLQDYNAWLMAWPVETEYIGQTPVVVLSGYLRTSMFKPMDDPLFADTTERNLLFRPTDRCHFWPSTRDDYAAKLEAYRVAFAFLRELPDDCLFAKEDYGLFVRRGGRLVVNEEAFTYNEENAVFLRPPELVTPYEAAVGDVAGLEHPDWPVAESGDDE